MMARNFPKTGPDSATELKEVARRLLRAADVGDRLPTPQDDIIECADLIKGGVIDLDDFKDSFLKKLGRVFFEGWSKVRGALAVKDRTIYVSADVPETQIPFLNFHEVAHKIIPWQRETFDLFADDYHTLLPQTEALFDQEANYLSALLLFQCDRLEKEAKSYRIGIGTGIKLAQNYGASYHSTLWHYAATNSAECAMLVLRRSSYAICVNGVLEQCYELMYSVQSQPFQAEFGVFNWDRHYPKDHPFTAVLNDPLSTPITAGDFEILNIVGNRVALYYEAWTNSYNIFVLIWKKQRSITPKSRIIIAT
jgi:hypothetical protein